MSRRAVLLSLSLAFACGAPTRTTPARMETIAGEIAGTELRVLPRDTRGRVWLSLWIDAGARDADPPQLATVAAWAAADGDVSAEVLADGIELTRPCDRDALDECLRDLATAASTRAPSPADVREARARLVEARRRAHADEARRADALALKALLAHGADPLGVADDDGRVSAEAVSAFLHDHFGAGRLLLVAVGDVDPSALRERVSSAFEDVPSAARPRSTRAPTGARALHIEVGAESVLAAATLRPHVADATRVARALVARVEADAPRARVSADVFPARGGAAVIARVHGEREDARRALFDHLVTLRLLAESDLQADDAPPPRDGPRAIARWIGARWAAQQTQPARGGLGVGLVLRGGRADRLDERDPDASLRDAARRALEEQIRALSEPVSGDGSLDDAHADLTLPGGARLFARRLAGADRVSALVLFEGGAAEDGPRAHGATALLTRTGALSCARVARRELGAGLDALGIRVEPVLRPSAWGVSVDGPSERWREVAYLATRCASVPYLEPAVVERARDAVMAIAERARERTRALAARAIAPRAPGRVAPLGGLEQLGRLGVRELVRMRETRAVQARARIAIAGDVPIAEATQALARGAARWPEGAACEEDPWIDPGGHLAGADHPEGRFQAVVAWMVEAPAGGGVAAGAFARAAARSLSLEPGLRARWHEGRADDGRGWALVALDATPDALDALPAHVARALEGLALEDLAAGAAREAEERRAWSQSSPRGVARRLATGGAEPPSAEEAQRILTALAESEPYFVILRPQPGNR